MHSNLEVCMFNKNIALYTKHPYTAGIIIVLWVGTLGIYLSDQQLPLGMMVGCNAITTLFLAYLGFRVSR